MITLNQRDKLDRLSARQRREHYRGPLNTTPDRRITVRRLIPDRVFLILAVLLLIATMILSALILFHS